VAVKGGPVMKPKFLALLCAILFVNLIMIMGCTTKGLNYESGLRSLEGGNYAEALKTFKVIADGNSKYKNRATFYVGECYKYLFKWDEAAESYQKVVDAEPTSYLGAEARNGIAQIREGRKDVERLKIFHDNNPGTDVAADALLELGSVYNNKLNDYNMAIETYRQLISEFPGSSKSAQAQVEIGYIHLYKLYNYDIAFKEFAKVNLATYPELKFRVSEIEDLRRSVNKTLLEISEQIAFIKGAQKTKILKGRNVSGYDIYGAKEDQVAQAFVAVAVKWRSLKNYPKALESYHMQLDRLPLLLSSSAESRYGIGEIHLDEQNYMEAIDAFDEFIARNPTYYRRPEAVFNVAICYESLRQYEKAYEYYKIYKDTYPEGARFKAAELKVRQYEYDEDQDGFPLYKELAAGTSDTDPNSRPSK
jgi:TolA-binding protein